MEKFLPLTDDLAKLINQQAAELHKRLQEVDADKLGLPSHCLHYYKSSHSRRLFFSIETSANLLYRSISLSDKKPADIILMDYGAGVGTLYLLAKMIGCKKVVYNDHLADWKLSAELIAQAIDIRIDEYIVGDIGDCLQRLMMLDIKCDIITSRNVVEHIYRLDDFFNEVHRRQPRAIIYSSTTANSCNPASVLKHIMWHRKWEKVYRGKRAVTIERQAPGLSMTKKLKLAKATRGLAVEDLEAAIEMYRKTGRMPDPAPHRTNTCDPSTGVWAEHLLQFNEYRKLIGTDRYDIRIEPGFWDTHYKKRYMNIIGRTLNRIITGAGKNAVRFAPFIYVVAIPRDKDERSDRAH